jgi:Tol biopolymer transport system component
VADDLRWVTEAAAAARREAPSGLAAWRRGLLGGAALLLAGLVGAGTVWVLRPSPAPSPVVRSLLEVRPADEVNAGTSSSPDAGGSWTALAWLPDGRTLVFVGRRDGVRQLWTRRIDEDEAHPLAGTEGATYPAVSPDGEWVAFWADGAIRKVPLSGGPVVTLVAHPWPLPLGMTWGAGGQLFYSRSPERAIWHVAPDGRTEAVTTPLETETHSLPSLLPGGEVLLFTVRKRVWTWGDEEVVAQVLATGERKVLLSDAVDARYVRTGHLVFMRRGVLFAVPFDPRRLAVQGPPVALLDGVSQALRGGNVWDQSGVGQFAVASTGSLAYIAEESTSYPDAGLVAVDREGRETPLSAPPRSYLGSPRLSPDGRRVTTTIQTLTERSGWVFDTGRGTLTRLTHEGEVGSFLLWTPDGQRIAFNQLLGTYDRQNVLWQPADGSAPPEVLARDAGVLCSWSPDGQRFATVKAGDIWAATLDGSKATLQRVTDTPHGEAHPEFSPDGRWLAYTSDESGRLEVYVQPWPGPGPRQQVSVDGGWSPAWNPSGREIFFLSQSVPGPRFCRAMMVVDVKLEPTLQLGRPRTLFEWAGRCPLSAPIRSYDVAPDGQRFFKTQGLPAPEEAPVTHIHLVQNWLEEVKARAAKGR